MLEIDTLEEGAKVKLNNEFRKNDGEVGEVQYATVEVTYEVELENGDKVRAAAGELKSMNEEDSDNE